MTEEQQAAQEANEAEAEAKASEAEATDDETTEETEESQKETKESDEESKQLEAELKREREAREKAEKALAKKAFDSREKKRQEAQEEVEEDKPLTRRELQAMLAEEGEKNRKILLETKANNVAESLTSNPKEKELVLTKWKNRTFPADMTLEEQIEECYGAYAYKQLKGKNSELKRALKGKTGVSTDASGTHQDAPNPNQPKLAGPDAAVMAQIGFKWNATNRRYEKKLANGKLLVKDPKTKQTQVIG